MERMKFINRYVFRQGSIASILIPIIVSGIFLYYLVSDGIFTPVLFIVVLFPVPFILSALRTKLVIEKDQLRYRKVFSAKEVSLKEISQIATNVVGNKISKRFTLISEGNQNSDSSDSKRYIYVRDGAGETNFTFPEDLIRMKERDRFAELVTNINPDIKVFNNKIYLDK